MKRIVPLLLALCLLTGCSGLLPGPAPTEPETIPSTTEEPDTLPTEPMTEPETGSTEPETELPTEPETVPTEPEHSPLYIPGLEVEDVITYFNEVCLDSEYTTGGDPSVIQKWTRPITYALSGDYTEEDAAAVESMAALLNGIEGFPGMYQSDGTDPAQLRIGFWPQEELMEQMGYVVNDELSDGIVEFWYDGLNQLYGAWIGVRSDISQDLHRSVVLEEIYNSLGPAQDTVLREDSIIYQYYSETQELSEVDILILRLLYHPDIICGMNADECAQVIRGLYY